MSGEVAWQDAAAPLAAASAFALTVAGLGSWLARWIPGTRLQRAVCAVGVGVVLQYFLQGVVFVSGLPAASGALTVMPAAAGWWVHRRAIGRAWDDTAFRRVAGASACVVSCVVLALLAMRTHAGGSWAGDWCEHYQRALFFADGAPLRTLFLGVYLLPARPPLANLAPAGFLAFFGRSYAVHALLLTVLNVLVVPVLFRLVEAWRVTLTRQAVACLTGLLLASPLLVQNVIFPWTKLACAFFCLLSLDQMVAGMRHSEPRALLWSAVLGAGGLLTHYAAAPFLLAMAAWVVVERRGRVFELDLWRSLAAPVGVGGVLSATWFAWSVAHYGWADTWGANTTVRDYSGAGWGGALEVLWQNLLATLVPAGLRELNPAVVEKFLNPENSPLWRWWCWHFAQVHGCLPLAGSAAVGVVVPLLLVRVGRSCKERGWLVAALVLLVIGIAAHGSHSHFGVAHICLQPLSLALVAWIAAWCDRLPLVARWMLAAGAVVDAVLGVLLGVHLLAQPWDEALLWHVDAGTGMLMAEWPTELPSLVASTHALQATFGFRLPGVLYPWAEWAWIVAWTSAVAWVVGRLFTHASDRS